MFETAVFVVAFVAGAVASVAGFGIGSLLTPLLAIRFSTPVAVAVTSIPHFVGTAVRFAMMRKHVDRTVLIEFGIMSAAGGLCGALLQATLRAAFLSVILGALLLFASFSTLSGLSKRIRFRGRAAWVAGVVSGFFGGLVGNQGGIRSAAMLGLHVPRDAFVATATAIGLVVDGARMPVYAWVHGREIAQLGVIVGVSVAGVVLGTIAGGRLLKHIPEVLFQRLVAGLIALLGFYMLYQGIDAIV